MVPQLHLLLRCLEKPAILISLEVQIIFLVYLSFLTLFLKLAFSLNLDLEVTSYINLNRSAVWSHAGPLQYPPDFSFTSLPIFDTCFSYILQASHLFELYGIFKTQSFLFFAKTFEKTLTASLKVMSTWAILVMTTIW